METLETLAEFSEKYPQIKGKKLQYAFLGGTAIRLIQESIDYQKDKRAVSDFDLLNVNGGNYPVHSCHLNDVFGSVSLEMDDVAPYLSKVNIKGKDYYFMNGTFVTVTKTCAIDNPREKDFRDVYFLFENGQINGAGLLPLFKKSERVTPNTSLISNTLFWILENPTPSKIKAFQTFPRLVNLLSDFKNYNSVRNQLEDYFDSEDKNGYQLASIIYDSHCLVREFKTEEEKQKVLDFLLKKAIKNDYTDFDRLIHQDLLPKFRYASKEKRKELIDFYSQ